MRYVEMKRILSGIMAFFIFAMGMANFVYAEETTWTCANCGKADNNGNFCSNCGTQKPQDSTWTCASCGQTGNTENYCTNCGSPKADNASSATIPDALAVGDEITLGAYEQDNLLFNGEEPIEWVVLTVQDGKAMLISKYILERKVFNEKIKNYAYSYATYPTWSECDLREWLNNDFYNAAFTDDEKGMIVDYTSELTTDHVFLLSVSEAKSFSKSVILSDDEVPRTEYAEAQGLNVSWYWLRTSGSDTARAAIVKTGYYNEIEEDGTVVYFDDCGVRPCIWIEY